MRSLLSLILAACAGLVAAAPVGAAEPARPNVLFIAVDDLNHWVGYLGRNPQAKTPNIDKLAARGVAFTRSYCVAPACNPSRAALLSGLRPSTTGIYHNSDDFTQAIPPAITLPATFRKAGYFVCGAGKIYHGGRARPEEWDDYFTRRAARKPIKKGAPVLAGNFEITPLDNDDDAMPDYHVVNYAIEQLNQKHDKPFFLAVGLVKPHLPFSVPRKYYALHPLDQIKLPPYREDDLADLPPAGVRMARPGGDHAAIRKTDTWKQAIQAYLAAGSFADAQIGRLLDALDKSPHRENTIIVFWGDHGWHLGEKHHWRKFALWEEATRAPLIWVAPGVTRPGGVCERTVDFMTIYPTLCDLCGVETPKHIEGASIRKLLADPKAAWDQPALTTHGRGNHAVRTERWRYIRYADDSEELYDEGKDPYEWTNLADRPESAAVKKELSRWLPTKEKPQPPQKKPPA